MNKILHVFLNSDLRCSHEGLGLIAKQNKIDVEKIEPGNFLIYINSKKTSLKLYAAHGVVAYLKLQKGQVLDLRTVALIPKAFNASGKIDYNKALKEVIEKELKR